MEFLLIVAVLAALSSVEAGVTTFEQPFLPAGIVQSEYNVCVTLIIS